MNTSLLPTQKSQACTGMTVYHMSAQGNLLPPARRSLGLYLNGSKPGFCVLHRDPVMRDSRNSSMQLPAL